MRRHVLLLLLALLPLSTRAGLPLPDGLYAEFNTSMGSFTAELDYLLAPLTVGNFVGLAEGSRPWLNEDTGLSYLEPFFNGKIFHRVIAGFVIQSGSHDGSPGGGPGYVFGDEFDPALRHTPYTLSMANSGPWSNGSQFFITLTSTSGLDDKHSVFGKIILGSNVVDSISLVATDLNDRPVSNVVIQSVNILRIGPAAQAFDVHAQGLPIVTNITAAITEAPLALHYEMTEASYTTVGVSPDLENFYEGLSLFQLGALSTNTTPVNELPFGGGDRGYYVVNRVQYETNALFPPSSMVGKDLLFIIEKGVPSSANLMRIVYTGPTTAQVLHLLGSYGFTSNYEITYNYFRNLPYRSVMVRTSANVPGRLNLSDIKFAFPSSPTNGVFSSVINQVVDTGTNTVTNAVPISGTFQPY